MSEELNGVSPATRSSNSTGPRLARSGVPVRLRTLLSTAMALGMLACTSEEHPTEPTVGASPELAVGKTYVYRRDAGRVLVSHLPRLMVPSNEPDPDDVPVAKSMISVSCMVNVPVAAANRPVPPTIVATSVMCAIFGGVNPSCPPAVVVNSWSPFAAVELKVPVLVAVG
jgi:hypothetical protein